MKIKVTLIAERDSTDLDIMEVNRQDHIIQILQLGYDSVTVMFEKLEDE